MSIASLSARSESSVKSVGTRILLGANIANTSFQEWFLRPGAFPGFCAAITGCRGFAAGKPSGGITQAEGSRNGIGMGKRNADETD
jgi:hypothetical protein